MISKLENIFMPPHANKGFKKRFILPFATSSASRIGEFTKNMEMAAVLYLAESGREKGESHLFNKEDEKIVFISEACYPLWLIPYDSANLVFDGLALASHSFSYDKTPNTEIFNKDIRRKQKTTETYTAALSRNINYFRDFKGKEKIQIGGLVTAPELKRDFKNYFPRMKEVRKPLTNNIILPPIIESHEIRVGIKQLSDLNTRIKKDMQSIDASVKLLNAITAKRVKSIREEISKTEAEHQKQTRKAKPKSTKRIRQIQGQYNRKIAGTLKRFDRSLLKLNKNQVNLKKTLKHLNTEAKRYEAKLQSCRRPKSKRGQTRWTLRLGKTKRKLATLNKEIKMNNRRIRKVENAQKSELVKQKIACLAHIESTNKKFRNLQCCKEAEIIMKRQEITTIEEITRHITKSMHQMIWKKKGALAELDAITMQRGKRIHRLLYIPFYLVRYEKGEKKRYALYPPSEVGDMGIFTKMKGALGATKVKVLIQPRSEAMTAFLNQLPALIEKKPMLEKSVTETGIRNSILLRKQLRVYVKKGLKELENEDWISRNELQTISRLLYMYSSSMNRRANFVRIPENQYLRCALA